jgi:hypothetical protein
VRRYHTSENLSPTYQEVGAAGGEGLRGVEAAAALAGIMHKAQGTGRENSDNGADVRYHFRYSGLPEQYPNKFGLRV